MEYLYRQLTPEDEEIIWRMLYEAGRMAEEGHASPEAAKHNQELLKYAKNWGRPGDIAVAAFEITSLKPIGAAWSRLLTGGDRGYGYFDDSTPELAMGVIPEHRNRGVGRTLLAMLVEGAQKEYASIGLSVRADSPAVRFYQRLGFEVVPGSELTNRVGGRSITMKRRLSCPPLR
jgi:ribosomal protein S18 acetylase RimI-like enzyme